MEECLRFSVPVLQVQLQYPAPAGRPGGAKPDIKLEGELPGFEPEAQRPSFGNLLSASLCTHSESRVWFEGAKKYQLARHTRSPVSLPEVSSCGRQTVTRTSCSSYMWHAQWGPVPGSAGADAQPILASCLGAVGGKNESALRSCPPARSKGSSLSDLSMCAAQVLSVGCGMANRGDVVWWQPVPAPDAAGDLPWLPAALSVTVDSEAGTSTVEEGVSTAELLASQQEAASTCRCDLLTGKRLAPASMS